jgi:hypothetical protein
MRVALSYEHGASRMPAALVWSSLPDRYTPVVPVTCAQPRAKSVPFVIVFEFAVRYDSLDTCNIDYADAQNLISNPVRLFDSRNRGIV